jgi:hypothetical protein
MSIYDKASLVLIPSGTKTSKVYSQKPTNGDGDFTFSRSTAATRVNADGNIEKETQNLLLQSNSFDTTWTNTRSTETSGQSGYDGTSDAWLLESTATATSAYIRQVISNSGVYTMSVYAKAGTSDWVALLTAGNQSAYFDLANGVLGSASSNVVDSSIESIGNGWYRCSATLVDNNDFYVFIANGDGNATTNSGDNIYIQDAQLEQGLVARDVITTTTAAVYGGITDNTPRLDYTDSSCPSLKLEPQRTNIMPSSEDIDSAWSELRVSVENNNTTSPEGFVNAGKTTATAVAGTHASYDTLNGSVTAGNDYFISCFVKKATTKYIRLNDGYTGAYVTFNFDDQTTNLQNGASNVLVEQHANGWYRLGFKFTADSSGNFQFALWLNDNNNNTSYTGSGEAVYFWGAQLEAGSYATSYIPTYGSSVTFAAESNSVTGISSLINNSEGTLFIEAATLENGADCRITYSNGTISNRVSVEWDANADTIKGFIGSGGFLETTSYDQTIMNKIALVYNTTDARLFINGTKVFTDSSVPSLSGMDRLEFSNYGGSLPFVGNTKQLLILKEKLTDQEAIDLTTI